MENLKTIIYVLAIGISAYYLFIGENDLANYYLTFSVLFYVMSKKN